MSILRLKGGEALFRTLLRFQSGSIPQPTCPRCGRQFRQEMQYSSSRLANLVLTQSHRPLAQTYQLNTSSTAYAIPTESDLIDGEGIDYGAIFTSSPLPEASEALEAEDHLHLGPEEDIHFGGFRPGLIKTSFL